MPFYEYEQEQEMQVFDTSTRKCSTVQRLQCLSDEIRLKFESSTHHYDYIVVYISSASCLSIFC